MLQDRIYNKYVRKSLDDLLQTSGTNSTPSSRSGRFRQRSPQNYCSNHFSTLLANDPFGKKYIIKNALSPQKSRNIKSQI